MSSEAHNDSIWDMSLFIDGQIAQAFACCNCHNIPRQCINDVDGKIYCEQCIAQLKMTNTRANSGIDKIIDGLKVKCSNINTKYNDDDDGDDDDDDNDNDDDEKEMDNNNDDKSKQKICSWTGTVNEWKKHNNSECPFAIISCKFCGKYESLRYLICSEHEDLCDEVTIECELKCGSKLFRKDMKLHLINDCIEQTQICKQCNRNDIKKKNLEKHLINECIERETKCKYADYGCNVKSIRQSLLEKHYEEYGIKHLELKMNIINNSLREEIKTFEKRINSQNKIIEHLKYRNCKLQMQIHQKSTLKNDFLIIFESQHNKNSFISGINFKYNSSVSNHNLIKSIKSGNNQIIYKRVKDCSYCFASNVLINGIIGITTKSRQQHIASCISTMNHCICRFNIIYRIGGDTLNVNKNNNICNIIGTDVVFNLPQLQIARFNHRVIYSKIHGILAVGGEPIKKEDAKRELKEIENNNGDNKRDKKKDKKPDKKSHIKAILNSVEQLNLAPTPALTHYYVVRNANIKKDEEKLQIPPEPELKWRNLGQSMKYRRDCPSVGLFKSDNKYQEQLFVAGGWNQRDLNYVEMYNFKKREWKQLNSLNVKRNSAGICEWKQKNNNMIIIGGWNKKTTTSVEEYDAHKNQWYVLKNTNYAHKYYPACNVYHDLNPFINSGYGVIVVLGNDGRLYGDEYIKKQLKLQQQNQNQQEKDINNQSSPKIISAASSSSSSTSISTTPTPSIPSIKDNWGFIEFYDPRDWIRKWTVIDNLPSFLNFNDDQCKQLYFQSVVACNQ